MHASKKCWTVFWSKNCWLIFCFMTKCSDTHSSTVVAVRIVQWQDYYWIRVWKRCARSLLLYNVMYSRIKPIKSPVILHDNLHYGSRKHYGPPISVAWLQLLRKPKTPGIPTALTSDTHLHPHDFAFSPDLWHQPRLAKICSWSWILGGINFAVLARHRLSETGETRTIPQTTYVCGEILTAELPKMSQQCCPLEVKTTYS